MALTAREADGEEIPSPADLAAQTAETEEAAMALGERERALTHPTASTRTDPGTPETEEIGRIPETAEM